MFWRRTYAVAIAVLALGGCASSGYGGSYNQYPDEAYYDGPYYGGGYDTEYDGDSNRYFRPARDVTCDRSRNVCYDRYGLSYHATARYLGEREANKAYKHYGDRVFLFSPKRGVTCDRRTQTCSSGKWTDRVYGENDSYRPRQQEFGNNVGNRPGTLVAPGACPPQGCFNK